MKDQKEMSCAICGRSSCTRSFHALEEQEQYDRISRLSDRQMISMIIDLESEVASLKQEIENIQKD